MPSLPHPHLPTAVIALALLLLTGCGLLGGSDPSPPGTGTVAQVVDGDTIEVALGPRTETVRLLGIDTPETVEPGAPVDCFGPEASARTKALLPEGAEVRLTRDVEVRDRFGRLLAYVERTRDGLFVNRSLVADGYARTLSIAPNDAHRGALAAAERDARRDGRGLWGACSGGPPR